MITTTRDLTKDQEQENAIMRRVIKCALDAGFTLDVHDGGGIALKNCVLPRAVFEAMKTTDEDTLFFRRNGVTFGWVKFVYGNAGYEVICDHTLSVTDIIAPATALAESYDLAG
jgi:hypothetical protein